MCTECNTDHHNSRKQTCLTCGEARAPKAGPKGKTTPKKAAAPKAAPSPNAGKPKESDEEVPRFPVPKQMSEYIVKTGHKLHTVAIPDALTESSAKGPEQLGDLATEQIQAALDGLASLKMPEGILRPFKDALEERKAKDARVYEPSKRLEQFTAQRNRTLKLKEELQAAVDEQRSSLAAAEARLQKTMQDLEFFQAEINKAVAETNHTAAAFKRASEPPPAMRGIKTALDQPDEVLAVHPEYMAYVAATAGSGGSPLSAIGWHMHKELQAYAAEISVPDAKRSCTSNSPARNVDADGDVQL